MFPYVSQVSQKKNCNMLGYPPFWGYPAKAHKPPRDTETIGGGCRCSGGIAGRWRDRDMIGIAMGHPPNESKRLQFSWRSLFFDRATCELS